MPNDIISKMMLALAYPSNLMSPSSKLVSKSCAGLAVKNSGISETNLQFPVARLPSKSIKIPSSGTIHNRDDFWIHETELQVRDYELDQYGVVHHATYATYCQHSLAKGLEMVSGDTDGTLAMLNLSFNFIAPLRRRDKFLVKHKVIEWSRTRIFLEHMIVKLHKQQPIMKASATAVWLDEKYRPQRIPPQVISHILELYNQCGSL